jgi:alkyl hydroperoxide reductase subunit AhpF
VSGTPVFPDIDRLGLARAFEQRLTGAVDVAISLPAHPPNEEAMAAAGRAQALLEELAALSPKLRLARAPFPALGGLDEDVPVVVTVTGRNRGGVHFGGAPAGYVVPILVNALIDTSRGEIALSPATAKVLEQLRNPVTVRMLVSATCATCESGARLALQMAIASPHVDTWILDAAQVPRLAKRVGARDLPAALINDVCWVPGAQAELALLGRVLFAGT